MNIHTETHVAIGVARKIERYMADRRLRLIGKTAGTGCHAAHTHTLRLQFKKTMKKIKNRPSRQ